MPSLPLHPALAPYDGISSSPSFPGVDSYYTNDDIKVLHHIVVDAQEDLAELPEGERLATNALFRAYDRVLPLYGIDPEQDHHISRLVFRIGGERGNGSLPDKFKAVLSRMGIEIQLEVDDDTVSFRAQSDGGSDTHSLASQRRWFPPSATPESQLEYGPLVHEQSPSPSSASTNHHESGNYVAGRLRGSVLSPIKEQAYDASSAVLPEADNQRLSRSRFFATTDTHTGWKSNSEPNDFQGNPNSAGNAFERILRHGHRNDEAQNSHPTSKTSQHAFASLPVSRSPHMNQRPNVSGVENDKAPNEPHPVVDTSEVAKSVASDNRWDCPGELLEPQLEARYERLDHLASRAWGLFQLTKAVSHWHVWTMEKIDRAAVARRHMTRFRHFRPWNNLTTEARKYGNQLTVRRIQVSWAHLARKDTSRRQGAREKTLRKILQHVIGQWQTCSTAQQAIPSYPTTMAQISAEQYRLWLSCFQQFASLRQRAGVFWRQKLFSMSISAWNSHISPPFDNVRRFEQKSICQDVLFDWELTQRSQRFQNELRDKQTRALLRRWHMLREAPLSAVQHTFSDRRGALVSVKRSREIGTIMPLARRQFALVALRTWQQHTWALQGVTQRSSVLHHHKYIRIAFSGWGDCIREGQELSSWADRANRYLGTTTTIHAMRRLARPRWDHRTRSLYARARWKQKHLNVRRLIARWKREMCGHGGAERDAQQSALEQSQRRLVLILHSWMIEHQELGSLDWSSHLPNTWVNEWAVWEESLRLLREEATTTWDLSLKSRVYARWRSISVHLHSQMYVVADVTEKNVKKSARRILLQWKHAIAGNLDVSRPSSFATSSMGPSRTSQAHGSSLWSRARSRPTAASSVMGVGNRGWLREAGEEPDLEPPTSDNGETEEVMHTPTRWTGLSSSLARLPTTTPLAPLSTPLERELRGRYDQNPRSSLATLPERLSLRGTPRLSVQDARRIAEGRRRKPPGW